ncbi:LysR family transcriptional regulator [Sphingopyxis sp. L1A2A]|uniref:LysR family transcriptional regulator n=1 Tax=Sphingopyxis sp. L1A2A TaxID=2502247 RepID=UPI0010F4DDD4|nr:LysR family transcriptional regulator [Sphingopyxis sp. L1A2A]
MSSWRGIEEFLAVVDQGSFTAAGDQLGLSKSYISKTVHELEERLGVQLLVRTTRRLSLTGAGESFHRECAQLQQRLGEVEKQVGLYSTEPVGRLRIGLSDIFGSDYMSALLAEFSTEHPGIMIEPIAYLNENEIVQESFDIVIRYGVLPNSNLRARTFGYLSYCLCAAPEYVAARGWPKKPEDLAEHDCLTDRSASITFNDGVGVRVQPRWASNSGIALRSAARKGLGIASLPVSVVRQDLVEGRILALEEEWSFYDRECWVVYSPGIMSVATRAFIDYLVRRTSRVKIRPSMAASLAARY